MNKQLSLILFLFFSISNIQNLSSQIDASYQIGTWKGFTESAVSYTWDDNSPKQLTVAKPIFDNYDFKMTFFVIIDRVEDWADFQTAADDGHEIASHTITHPNFGSLDEAQRQEELVVSKNTINANITGQDCVTFAYPFCAVGSDEQTASLYMSARTCQGEIENSTPQNFMQVSSINCGTQGPIYDNNDFTNQVNSAIATNGWVVFLLHGVDDDGGWSPIPSVELDTHLNYMNDHRDEFWVATYRDVVKYIKERDAASLVELSNTDNEIIFELSHDLDNDLFDLPLSVKRILPLGWTDISVSQNEEIIDFQIVEENGEMFVQFDVLPNGGNIEIIDLEAVATNDLDNSLSALNIFPTPANTSVTIDFSLKEKHDLNIFIVDLFGRKINEIANETFSNGDHQLVVDISRWRNQQLFFVIAVDGILETRKIITN